MKKRGLAFFLKFATPKCLLGYMVKNWSTISIKKTASTPWFFGTSKTTSQNQRCHQSVVEPTHFWTKICQRQTGKPSAKVNFERRLVSQITVIHHSCPRYTNWRASSHRTEFQISRPGASESSRVRFRHPSYYQANLEVKEETTLQGTNISHLGKRKIILKIPFLGDMLVPWRITSWSNHVKNFHPEQHVDDTLFSGQET